MKNESTTKTTNGGQSIEPNQTLLEAFYEHRNNLFSYFARKLLKPQDVDDLLQETFLEAFKSNSKIQISSPKGYLFVIARNLLSKRYKSEAKMRMDDFSEAVLEDLTTDPSLVDNDLHNTLKLESLVACLTALPTQSRKVFVYKKFHGMTQKQIASELGITISTVERHITIALLKIRQLMRDKGYDDVHCDSELPCSIKRLKGE
tara:strand:+ start:44234 stop:44845 length:612 start_codon:yes stop_codon:yes gene_type:complete